MRILFARRPSPAMVIACLALLVAQRNRHRRCQRAGPNSVGTAQLKPSP